MGNPYPKELRERVINAYLKKDASLASISRRFDVGYRTVLTWCQQYRLTGHIEPKPHAGGTSRIKVLPTHKQALLDWLAKIPCLTNRELAALLLEHHQLTISPQHISKVLKALGFSRKKNVPG